MQRSIGKRLPHLFSRIPASPWTLCHKLSRRVWSRQEKVSFVTNHWLCWLFSPLWVYKLNKEKKKKELLINNFHKFTKSRNFLLNIHLLRNQISPASDLWVLINVRMSSAITERAPTVRNVTRPVSCALDQDPSPARPVCPLSWNCKALSCVLNVVLNASFSSPTSANNATPVVRPAQVRVEEIWRACVDWFVHQCCSSLIFVSHVFKCVKMRSFVGHVCLLQMPLRRTVWHATGETR